MAGGLSDVRYLRWSYLLPRLAILCVLWAASEWGVARLLKWSITSGGPAVTGARVDVAETRASLLHTRVAIKEVEIADPDEPMRNLASVESIELNLDRSALLRKKAVVDRGVVRGLRFGTPRTTSGELPAEVTPASTEASRFANGVAAASEYAANWLADIEQKLTLDARAQFESVRLAEELAMKWPAECESLSADAKRLQAEIEQLTTETKAANQNPLRNTEFLRALPERVKTLQREARDLQARLQVLPGFVEADRERVLAARERDERFIREQFGVGAIDAGDLTAYLLGKQITGPVEELVEWLRWARKIVPGSGKAPTIERTRGEDILFAGATRHPEVLVRMLDLHGVAKLGGRPIELSGTLTDFTTEPKLHGEPMRLRLVSQGTLPIQVQAVIDRTGAAPRDELLAVCNGLAIPGMSLGESDTMSIGVSPNTAAIQIAVLLENDKLTGNIDLVQKQVQITPVVAERFGAPEIEQALAKSLGRVNEVTTQVVVTGTLAKPQVEIRSTLGVAVENAVRETMVSAIDRQREKLLAKTQTETNRHFGVVQSKIETATAEIAPLLAQPEEMLAKLLGPDLAKPFSADQFGRLPAGSLFK